MSKAQLGNWSLVLAIAIGTLFRLPTLGRKSLWLDEVATLQIAQQGSNQIISNTTMDPHPPLYYLVMHEWIAWGQSEFMLRLPSALAGIIAIPLLYALAREWLERWSATASAWLLALAPVHIWYSQETRSYALECTVGLVSMLAYTIAIRRSNALAWVGWIVATVIGLYISYSVFLLLAAQIFLLFLPSQIKTAKIKTLIFGSVALLFVLLLYLPQLSRLNTQLTGTYGVAYYYVRLQQFLSSFNIDTSSAALNGTILLMVFGLLASAGVFAWWGLRRIGNIHVGIVVVALTLIAYVLVLPASVILRGLLIKRQLLVVFPYGLAFVAMVIGAYRHRRRLLIGVSILTVFFAGYVSLIEQQENWRAVVAMISARALANEVILLDAGYVDIAFDYYYRGLSLRQGVGPSDVPAKLEALTQAHQNVWLVLSNDIYSDPQASVQRWLDQHLDLRDGSSFAGVRVMLYNGAR